MNIHTRMAAALLIALPAVTLATPITFEFAGNVTFTSDPLGLDRGVAAGSAFSGSFTFDDAMAPAFTIGGSTTYLNLISAFDVAFDGASFTRAASATGPSSPDSSAAQISNNRDPDGADAAGFQSALQPLGTDPAGALFFRNVSFGGVSSNQNTFSDGSLPTTLDITAFDRVPLALFVTYDLWASTSEITANGQIYGQVTSLRAVGTSVPEPATFVLFATASGLLLLARRRRLHASQPR